MCRQDTLACLAFGIVALRPLLRRWPLEYNAKADYPDQMGKKLPPGLMPLGRQFQQR
jgi:hypothetical protein